MAALPGNQVTKNHPLTTTTVSKDSKGWRTQWILEGLSPSTNYTVFVVQNDSLVSPPLYFSTKSGQSCAKVSSNREMFTNCHFSLSRELCLHSRAFVAVLSLCDLLCTAPRPSRTLNIVHPKQLTLEHLRPSVVIYFEFYDVFAYVCLRSRYLLARPKLRLLSESVSRMGVLGVLPSLYGRCSHHPTASSHQALRRQIYVSIGEHWPSRKTVRGAFAVPRNLSCCRKIVSFFLGMTMSDLRGERERKLRDWDCGWTVRRGTGKPWVRTGYLWKRVVQYALIGPTQNLMA